VLVSKDITLDKQLTRSLVRYHLSEADLRAFIDKIWAEFGEYSSIPRDDFDDDGQPIPWDVVRFHFQGTDWPPLDNAVIYNGPTNSQYGGPIWYFDRSTNTVYQATFYW
jgi:hypothetical protein